MVIPRPIIPPHVTSSSPVASWSCCCDCCWSGCCIIGLPGVCWALVAIVPKARINADVVTARTRLFIGNLHQRTHYATYIDACAATGKCCLLPQDAGLGADYRWCKP